MISGSKVGFFNLSQKSQKKINESKSKKSKLIGKLLKNPELLLTTISVANNLINITIVILFTYLCSPLLTEIENPIIYILIQIVGAAFIVLLFGEIIQKICVSKSPEKMAKIMAYPLYVSSKIFYPISYVLIKSTNRANKNFKNKQSSDTSIQELSQTCELKDDKETLTGIVNSSSLDVKEIMTSRVDIFAIEYNSKFTKVLAEIVETGFSRIPVYVDNLDNIKGILYIKDVLPYLGKEDEENFEWQKLIRPHFIVPETKKINKLLSDFQTRKLHIALIVDEYGGVSGLVTLEDILEEFVGEIHDELDVVENNYSKISDNVYEFDAKTSIVDFCKIVGIDYNLLHDLKGESDSLAGLILETNGEIPSKNAKINIGDLEFTVTSANDRRIKKIKVKIN
jgi:gliding motility-associated protein GldE